MDIETMKQRFLNWKVVTLSTLVIFSSAMSLAGPFQGRHGGNPIEHLLDYIDLSDAQTQKIETIMAESKPMKEPGHRMEMMKGFMALNPDDPNYMADVESMSEAAAAHMKAKIISMAEMRKKIYAVLTESQKQELNTEISEKMAKMEKRMSRHGKHHW